MEQFDRYFQKKMNDAEFKTLYEAECNVCAKTMQIFEKADLDNLSIASLAKTVDADTADVEALRDADHCNPSMVIRLCRHLGLGTPDNCPKRNNDE